MNDSTLKRFTLSMKQVEQQFAHVIVKRFLAMQKELYTCARKCIAESEQKLPGVVRGVESSLKSV